jgi:hypothetical protein
MPPGGGGSAAGGEDGGSFGDPYNDPPPRFNPGVDAHVQAEIEREKQGYLLELIKFKKDGHELTRDYTMDDSLVDIQFEYDRIKNGMDTSTNVAFLREALLFSFQAVELANNKWGPVLELDGWSQEAAKDKDKYNRVIERLYKKHWRFGSMSPETEFAWLIGSSMVGHHVKKKWGIGASMPSASGPSMNPMSMFASMAGMGGVMGGGAKPPPFQGNAPPPPPSGAAGPRPVMSRPVMRGAPSFTVPPPPTPDPTMVVLQEQRREAERELQAARAEMSLMQQQQAQQQARMQAEFARQQFAQHQQMEAMAGLLRQHVPPPPPTGVRDARVMEIVRDDEAREARVVNEEEGGSEKDSEEDEEESGGKEVSIVGEMAPRPVVGRRQTTLPPLKLDL